MVLLLTLRRYLVLLTPCRYLVPWGTVLRHIRCPGAQCRLHTCTQKIEYTSNSLQKHTHPIACIPELTIYKFALYVIHQ